VNWILSLGVSVLSISPKIQDSNPRSGLAQSGMVVAYTSYLITSAIANHDDDKNGGSCNPLTKRAAGARTGMVVMGAIFTFLAIAYSTSRAATQSKAFAPGKGSKGSKGSKSGGGGNKSFRSDPEEMGYSTLSQNRAGDDEEASELGGVTTKQPGRKDTLRYQALQAAVAEGYVHCIPLSRPRLVLILGHLEQITSRIRSRRIRFRRRRFRWRRIAQCGHIAIERRREERNSLQLQLVPRYLCFGDDVCSDAFDELVSSHSLLSNLNSCVILISVTLLA